MKKLITIVLLVLSMGAFAQQGPLFDITEQDSTQMKLKRQIEYTQLISGLSDFVADDIKLPNINYKADFLNRYKVSYEFSPIGSSTFNSISSGMFNSFHSPFFSSATVLSSAAYQLGDKFTMGGFSYGANSIFSATHPNRGINNFDSFGSTLFMQYKVSKNFSIETRVNVQQGGHHGF